MTPEDKEAFFRRVQHRMIRYGLHQGEPVENLQPWLARNCLRWTVCLLQELHKDGHSGMLQAGTALWPRIRPEQDDGLSTHFGHQWEPENGLSKLAASLSFLPEMHVWAAAGKPLEILDFTTGYWPRNCLEMLGQDWPGDQPPEFFWGTPEQLPSGVIYHPDLMAINQAIRLIPVILSETAEN